MSPRTCLCGLLSLSAGSLAAGWYLISLYGALLVLNTVRLVRQAERLRRLDAALANCSGPPTASLRGQHDALTLAVKMEVFETLFFVASGVAACALVAGAAWRSRRLVAVFLCWFAPVTVLQGAALLLALLRPVYRGVRACSGSGCLEAFWLMMALLALHGYLNWMVFSFLRELRQQSARQRISALSVPPDSDQEKNAVKYAFEDGGTAW